MPFKIQISDIRFPSSDIRKIQNSGSTVLQITSGCCFKRAKDSDLHELKADINNTVDGDGNLIVADNSSSLPDAIAADSVQFGNVDVISATGDGYTISSIDSGGGTIDGLSGQMDGVSFDVSFNIPDQWEV